MTDSNMAMASSYDYGLSRFRHNRDFRLLRRTELAGRTTAARGRVRLAWLIGGATAMGVGICPCTTSECWLSACRYGALRLAGVLLSLLAAVSRCRPGCGTAGQS